MVSQQIERQKEIKERGRAGSNQLLKSKKGNESSKRKDQRQNHPPPQKNQQHQKKKKKRKNRGTRSKPTLSLKLEPRETIMERKKGSCAIEEAR